MSSTDLLLAYYGDDFTGSTDVLEVLSLAGLRTVLFIQPPSPEQLIQYGNVQAIGVAGMTRSMVPEEMEKELRPAFRSLKASGARHVHYKVCSTFDSSPQIGSIGKAIDIGAEIFECEFVPLVVAAPALGRYCSFGNLYARMGIGSMGKIYRLDRHPSMSRHPVTPADESDLRLFLYRQTAKSIGLMDILQIAAEENTANKILASIIADGAEVVLFDGIYQDQMKGIGRMIDRYSSNEQPLFSVGSSGVETALTAYWTSSGRLKPQTKWQDPGYAGPLLVASGSCSPVTSAQIASAIKEGFTEVAVDTVTLAADGNVETTVEENAAAITRYISAGKSVILHTSRGTDDLRVGRSNEIFNRKKYPEGTRNTGTAALYGGVLGQVVRRVAEATNLKRIVLSGGDTSSYAARAMGIEAVEMIAPLSPGAPLCKAHAPGSAVDGLEVNFKGGQVGDENYFCMVREGRYTFHSPQRT